MVIAPSQPVGATHGEAGQQENRQPAQNENNVGQHPMLLGSDGRSMGGDRVKRRYERRPGA